MLLQDIEVQRPMIQTIIPFVQGDAVIINETCRIDLSVELSVSLCLKQKVFIFSLPLGCFLILDVLLYNAQRRTANRSTKIAVCPKGGELCL